ncbi:flagellar basal body rod protein FlgB [Pelagibius sp.]|uniref:flagellar basal body rod protein FlgB n=1 Tax=Pelagibius sp. TaxID=1931238 RepID=UPI002616B0A6|nr:flagellar basal body rod protein FlgB [Pelagibius sp.]
MDGKPGLFSLLAKRMDWLGQRQKVLAQNIANADTPKFVPHDLKAQEFRRLIERQAMPMLRPEATQAGHIQTSSLGDSHRSTEQKERYETAPSGNAVVIEEQLVKVAQTQSDFNAITNLYRKQVAMMKMALRGRAQ